MAPALNAQQNQEIAYGKIDSRKLKKMALSVKKKIKGHKGGVRG